MANKRYLGVDYGDKRMGLALADDDSRMARAWRIVELGRATPLETIRNILHGQHITDIVVGLPRNLDGDDTEQTKLVRQFVTELNRLGLPVHLQDEAATSSQAHEEHPDKRHIDDEAAAIILQDYLRSH